MYMNFKCTSITWQQGNKPSILLHNDISKWEDNFKKSGGIILHTCNRFEVYYTQSITLQSCPAFSNLVLDKNINVHTFRGEDAARHLFNVTCGIESDVLGENEILRQVKNLKPTQNNKELNILLKYSIEIGKHVRSETNISLGTMSLASCTMKTIASYNTPENINIGILGYGMVGKNMHSASNNYNMKSTFVFNRSITPYDECIEKKGIWCNNIHEVIQNCNVIICCVSSNINDIPYHDLHDKLIIDLSSPSCFNPDLCKSIPGTQLIDLNEITSIMNISRELRESSVVQIETKVEEKLYDLKTRIEEEALNELRKQIAILYVRSPQEKHSIMKVSHDSNLSINARTEYLQNMISKK